MKDATEPAVEVLLNSKEASRVLNCSTRETRRLVLRGLPVVRFPGSRFVRFRPSALRRFMEENERSAA